MFAAAGEVVGPTSFMDIRPSSRGVEIGGTRLSPAHRRTRANTEQKYLTLRRALEELKANRVCLKTDLRNERSRKAIERLGAKEEGVLRRQMDAREGHLRDSVSSSIVSEERAGVRERPEEALR